MGAEEPVDCRQWTQHHLVAADIRVAPAMALTPPQGDADTDGMDVNVRGPGEYPSPKDPIDRSNMGLFLGVSGLLCLVCVVSQTVGCK